MMMEGNQMDEVEKLERKRKSLHEYIIMKLDEQDYHAVQDAGSDLRELEVAYKYEKDKEAIKK